MNNHDMIYRAVEQRLLHDVAASMAPDSTRKSLASKLSQVQAQMRAEVDAFSTGELDGKELTPVQELLREGIEDAEEQCAALVEALNPRLILTQHQLPQTH